MIYAIHGFLGLPSDWDFLKPQHEIEAENFLQYTSMKMQDWAEKKSYEIALRPGRKVLLAYSMGGRLAMHLLLANPKIWDAAIIVSANPGTSSIEEHATRKKLDHKWAQKFLKSDWATLLYEWDRQSLFQVQNPAKDAVHLQRNEKDFDRAKLAEALENWSIAHQENLAPRLAKVTQPILWLAGENDEKYRCLLSGFAQVSNHRYKEISQAAHRVPWDHPSEFIRVMNEFLNSVLLIDSPESKN
jgi:2-succinyl-6-hydroxy-2,4-cyclohexadiene-1-carboxylate synthase